MALPVPVTGKVVAPPALRTPGVARSLSSKRSKNAMRSVDFAGIVGLQQADAWDEAANVLAKIGRDLRDAGAACLLICTNTMHKLADDVRRAVDVPLLHIVDVTAEALKAGGVKRPLLLATRYTMEQDFFLSRLRERHGIDAMVPAAW